MANFQKDITELKTVPPFSWLSESQLQRALRTVQYRQYPAREVIAHAGSPADGLYIVLRGRVQLIYENSRGRRFIAASVRAHDFFGELGLFEGGPSAITVISSEPCEVLHIPRAVVLECLSANAQAAMCMLNRLVKRLALSQRKLAQFALSDVYERVASVLLEHTPESRIETTIQVGSEEIAGLVGSSREMVSRVLKTMIEARIVRRRGRKLVILDPAALRASASSGL